MQEHLVQKRFISQPSLLPALVRKVVHQPITLAVAATTVLTIATFSHLPASKEVITQKQVQERLKNFQAAIPLSLPTVSLNDAHERHKALNSMQLTVTETKQVASDLKRNPESRLIWIVIWDDVEEDGDVVELKSISFTRKIPIFHTPQSVALYVAPGEKTLVLTGIRDGHGGITAAVRTNTGIIPLPYIWPGQSIAIPIL